MKETDNKLNYYTSIKYLSKYMSKFRVNYLMFYFGWLFDTLLEIITPILFGIMINQIVYYKNIQLFIKIGVLFFVISLFSCILYYFIYEMHSFLWDKTTKQIRINLFNITLNMETEEMSNSNYGDIVSQIQWGVNECTNFIIRDVIHNINNYIKIIMSIIMVFVINIWIGLVMIILLPISAYVSLKFGKEKRSQSSKNRSAYGKYISWLMEVINSFKDIRLLNAEDRLKKVFLDKQEELIKTDINSGVASLKAEQIITIVDTIIKMGLYVILALLATNQNITIGTVVVILTYFSTLSVSLQKVSSSYMDAQYRISVIQRIKDFENKKSKNWVGEKNIVVLQGNIEFKNIKFAYQNNTNILCDVNLQINAGEKIAIVGESGCGKTTLAYMLIGFYCPISGDIEIDSQSISIFSLFSIRENIGIVQQEVLIFDGTIRENLLLGSNQVVSDSEIITACKAAGLYDFIIELEQGFDTVLGKNGRLLSGGQKQRLSIARIYIKNPKIIIFDEATSSLDKSTEQKIHEAWKKLLAGRTSIIIAHRQSSVELCDRVAILEKGRIVEIDTPKNMKKYSEKYQELFAIKEEELYG